MSETCRVLFKNKFEKLVHLVGFIIRMKKLIVAIRNFANAPKMTTSCDFLYA